jgi:hypothetical protein
MYFDFLLDTCVCIEAYIEKIYRARHQWLTPVILSTPEAEIRRIMV